MRCRAPPARSPFPPRREGTDPGARSLSRRTEGGNGHPPGGSPRSPGSSSPPTRPGAHAPLPRRPRCPRRAGAGWEAATGGDGRAARASPPGRGRGQASVRSGCPLPPIHSSWSTIAPARPTGWIGGWGHEHCTPEQHAPLLSGGGRAAHRFELIGAAGPSPPASRCASSPTASARPAGWSGSCPTRPAWSAPAPRVTRQARPPRSLQG